MCLTHAKLKGVAVLIKLRDPPLLSISDMSDSISDMSDASGMERFGQKNSIV